MPERCIHQLGYVQTVPQQIFRPSNVVRPWSSMRHRVEVPDVIALNCWGAFPNGSLLNISRLTPARTPSACDESYMHWYTRHSHSRLMNDIRTPTPTVKTRRNSEM